MQFKSWLKKQKAAVKRYFKRDVIIHVAGVRPGKLLQKYNRYGEKYVSIGFFNRLRTGGVLPVMEVRAKDITHMRRLPSDFQRDMCRLMGKKATGKLYKITK